MNSNLPKSSEESKALLYLFGGVVAIVLVAKLGKQILDTFKGLTGGIGLTDSEEGKANAAYIDKIVNKNNTLGNGSPWSPKYYDDVKQHTGSVRIFTESSAKAVAKRFYDSVGYIYDSPAEGMAAIKQISSKVKLSQVCDIFNRTYNKDLLNWLNDKYDAFGQREYLRNILQYAENLPVQ